MIFSERCSYTLSFSFSIINNSRDSVTEENSADFSAFITMKFVPTKKPEAPLCLLIIHIVVENDLPDFEPDSVHSAFIFFRSIFSECFGQAFFFDILPQYIIVCFTG